MIDWVNLVLGGIVGTILGAIISPYLTHWLNKKFLRQELILKMQIEAYQIVKNILENRKDLYLWMIKDMLLGKDVKKEAINRIYSESQIDHKQISKYLEVFKEKRLSEKQAELVLYEGHLNIILNTLKSEEKIEEKVRLFDLKITNFLRLMREEIGI